MKPYRFKNINKFSKNIAKLVARQGGYSYKELKSFINVGNVINIVKEYAHVEDDSFTLTVDETNMICEEIFDWLVGVELAKLAADDVVDCYWDDKDEQMIFKRKIENE